MSVQVKGFKELERALKALPDRVRRKVMRAAMSAAGTPVLKAARAKAPKESGLLRKSLAKKTTINRKRASVATIIGPRKSVVGTHKGKPRKPSRYAHLAEKGFINEQGEHVPPQPFLNPAMQEQQGAALNVLQTKLGEGIEREAKKAA